MANYYAIDTSTPTPYEVVDLTKSAQFTTPYLVIKSPELPGPPPKDLGTLLTAKYQEIRATKPVYTRFNSFTCLDSTQFNVATSSKTFFGAGLRHASILPTGQAVTATVTLTGATPNFCVAQWEAYHLTDSDLATTLYLRQYQEASPANLAVSISFNGGTNFNTITNDSEFSIPAGHRGLSMIVRVTNNDTVPIYLGSLEVWSATFS